VIERALAAADAAEVEAQHRKIAVRERVVELVGDLMVHRPAELRVRMQDDRDRRILLLGRMEAAFDPSSGSGEDDLGHGTSIAGFADCGSRSGIRLWYQVWRLSFADARLTSRCNRRNYLELF